MDRADRMAGHRDPLDREDTVVLVGHEDRMEGDLGDLVGLEDQEARALGACHQLEEAYLGAEALRLVLEGQEDLGGAAGDQGQDEELLRSRGHHDLAQDQDRVLERGQVAVLFALGFQTFQPP